MKDLVLYSRKPDVDNSRLRRRCEADEDGDTRAFHQGTRAGQQYLYTMPNIWLQLLFLLNVISLLHRGADHICLKSRLYGSFRPFLWEETLWRRVTLPI